MMLRANERATFETDLRRALNSGEFSLVYQPQIDLRTSEVVGFEALLRWHHPSKGPIPPDHFIPMAEEAGLMGRVGAWVVNRACADVAAWQIRGLYVPRVAINLSPQQLVHGLEIELDHILRKYNIIPSLLELEITETALLEKRALTLVTLQEVRNLGISLALDDFGTGYSSLSHLREYPIQRLKIDRSFVSEITRQAADVALASAIISLAKSMTIQVIAEGIETFEQLNLLSELGCHEGQGFLLGRPCTADRVSNLLEGSRNLALRAELS